MPRISSLNDILFPVEVHPIFASFFDPGGERRLLVPDKRAIVNAASKWVLSIVSRNYRLVTNREALEWAYQCCRTVFPETQPAEWEVNAVDAPATGGHCFFDLVHNSAALDFAFVLPNARPEVYGPFIRVANSYNGLRALKFDIGFYRKVCRNGLIVPRSIIQFKFSHVHRDIGETIQFVVAHDELTKLKASFGESLEVMRGCKVDRTDFEPLLRKVLSLRESAPLKKGSHNEVEWAALGAHLSELSGRYASQLGENAYAVLNAATDFATHPPVNQHVHRDRHSFQRLAGSWLTEFCKLCRERGFSVASYLSEPAKVIPESRAA